MVGCYYAVLRLNAVQQKFPARAPCKRCTATVCRRKFGVPTNQNWFQGW